MRTPFLIYIVVCLCISILTYLFTKDFLWPLATFALLALAGISYGAAQIRSGFFISSYSRYKGPEPYLALTFDDGPDPEKTPEILAVLDKYNVHASFFLIGHRAEKYPEIVRGILEKGHDIGNHTYSHSLWFDFWGSGKMLADINRLQDILMDISQKKIAWFRPPYGVTNPPLAKAVKKSGLRSIGWSFRTLDTVPKKKKVLSGNLLKNSKPGDIILLHDTTPGLSEILDRYIPAMQAKKFIFVSVSEMINNQDV